MNVTLSSASKNAYTFFHMTVLDVQASSTSWLSVLVSRGHTALTPVAFCIISVGSKANHTPWVLTLPWLSHQIRSAPGCSEDPFPRSSFVLGTFIPWGWLRHSWKKQNHLNVGTFVLPFTCLASDALLVFKESPPATMRQSAFYSTRFPILTFLATFIARLSHKIKASLVSCPSPKIGCRNQWG
jgi:hypothetical protein